MNKCEFDPNTEQFTFKWQTAVTPSCAPITEYNLKVKSGFSSPTKVDCNSPTANTCTVKANKIDPTNYLKLSWGDVICPMVSAENDFGESSFSVESDALCCKYEVTHACVTDDTKPATLVSEAGDAITYSFTPLSNTKGGPVNYKVLQRTSGERTWKNLNPIPLPEGSN